MTTDEALGTQNAQLTAPESGLLQCRKGCDRTFPSAPSRNMHEVRAHGKNWDTSKNFASKNQRMSREQILANKRDYNRRYRARLKRGGVPVGTKLPKWTPERRAKFEAKIAAKRNGALPQAPQHSDNIGEAARAIMIAARVLQATAIGMKL